MNVPYTAIHFSTYESAKILLGQQESNDSEETLSTQVSF